MLLHGRDCRLTILTADRKIALPYSAETIREAVYVPAEEASIEGGGNRRAIRKSAGVTGCIITPLTIGTAPLLWALALGEAGPPLFVSETRNLYKHTLRLTPLEDSPAFTLIRERGAERVRFENCRVSGFELRIMRGGTPASGLGAGSRETAGVMPGVVYLRLDISGEEWGGERSEERGVKSEEPDGGLKDGGRLSCAERFRESGVGYVLNGVEHHGIYGLTVTTVKKGGTKTEVWIKRVLEQGIGYREWGIGGVIENLAVTARLFRDRYEWRTPGAFRLTLSNLLLMTDETNINTSGPVIGPLRYYCAGEVRGEVFTCEERSEKSGE